MMYEFFAKTDRGLARGNNEDSVVLDAACGLVVLADGMGGYNAGEVASGMATDSLRSELGRWLSGPGVRASAREVRHMMELCVDAVNDSILESAQKHADYAGMGTTLVVGVFRGDRLILGHIGDSRCYRLRDGVLQQITHDHSLLQEQLDAGLLTPQQAAASTHRHLVTRALGVEPSVQMDVNEFQVAPEDLFLMCSDGLTDMVSDADIAEMARARLPPEEKAALLIDTANAQGGHDNISVVLVHAAMAGKKRRFMSRWSRAA